MGSKTTTHLWCPRCKKTVVSWKSTHRVRNTAAIGALPATSMFSAGLLKSERFRCVTCGTPTGLNPTRLRLRQMIRMLPDRLRNGPPKRA